MNFTEIKTKDIDFNVFEKIDKEWMLICTQDSENERMNAMTASWGGMGIVWNKPVVTLLIRPTRHTYKLAEEDERMSVCFLSDEYKKAKILCGRESGRDTDKIKKTSLTSAIIDGVPVIDESQYVFILRKIYADNLREEHCIDKSILLEYPNNDYHRFYICEIEKIYRAY